MRRVRIVCFVVGALGCLSLFGSAAVAADGNAQQTSRPAAASTKAVQRFDFEDDDVIGNRESGYGELVTIKQRARRTPLLVIRRSFVPELIKSAEDI